MTTPGPTVHKMPVSVRILGKRWPIVRRRIKADDGESDAKLSVGACTHLRTEIDIDPAQSRELMRDTVLHEIVHALDQDLALGMKEAQVGRMATGLLAVLRDNPGLVRFLTD